MSVRAKFVELFGEDQCAAVEMAARGHANEVNSGNKGSDPFKWALTIVLGYQCCEVDRYREDHGITLNWDAFRATIKEHGELNSHDGDVDYLALMAGVYEPYIVKPEAAQ
jgi:hypothetical protein